MNEPVEEPKLTGSQRRKLRRDQGLARISGTERKEMEFSHGAHEMGKVGKVFPDTSEASQQKSREGYRQRAHIRKAKAAERRQKRALARRTVTPQDDTSQKLEANRIAVCEDSNCPCSESLPIEMKEPTGDE